MGRHPASRYEESLKGTIRGLNRKVRSQQSEIDDLIYLAQALHCYSGGMDYFMTCVINSHLADMNGGRLDDHVIFYRGMGDDEVSQPFRLDLEVCEDTYREYGKRYRGRPLGRGIIDNVIPRFSGIELFDLKGDAPPISQVILPGVADFFDLVEFRVIVSDYSSIEDFRASFESGANGQKP